MNALENVIYRAERKAKAIDLLGGECVACGSEERLEFDHINNDREDMAHRLSNMWNFTWDKIVAELEKCQLLCRSCHAKKSMRERGFENVGGHGKVSTYSHGCRCDECREANRVYKREYARKRYLMAVGG